MEDIPEAVYEFMKAYAPAILFIGGSIWLFMHACSLRDDEES